MINSKICRMIVGISIMNFCHASTNNCHVNSLFGKIYEEHRLGMGESPVTLLPVKRDNSYLRDMQIGIGIERGGVFVCDQIIVSPALWNLMHLRYTKFLDGKKKDLISTRLRYYMLMAFGISNYIRSKQISIGEVDQSSMHQYGRLFALENMTPEQVSKIKGSCYDIAFNMLSENTAEQLTLKNMVASKK